MHDRFKFESNLQYWVDENEMNFPKGVEKFIKIASMHSELIALADDGRLYSWSWNKSSKPSNLPHSINSRFFNLKNSKLNFFKFL